MRSDSMPALISSRLWQTSCPHHVTHVNALSPALSQHSPLTLVRSDPATPSQPTQPPHVSTFRPPPSQHSPPPPTQPFFRKKEVLISSLGNLGRRMGPFCAQDSQGRKRRFLISSKNLLFQKKEVLISSLGNLGRRMGPFCAQERFLGAEWAHSAPKIFFRGN